MISITNTTRYGKELEVRETPHPTQTPPTLPKSHVISVLLQKYLKYFIQCFYIKNPLKREIDADFRNRTLFSEIHQNKCIVITKLPDNTLLHKDNKQMKGHMYEAE